MQIQNTETSYSLSRTTRDLSAQGAPKTISEVWKEQGFDSQPVKVDISKEGLNAYKERFQKDDSDRDFKSLNLRLMPGEMAWGNEGWPDIDEFLGWGTMWKMMDGKVPRDNRDIFTPVKDKASALMSAYKETYAEIVKGYEDGTRARYVVDMDTDELYRKATMEEDLAYLRKEFEERAASLERDHISACQERKMLADASMNGFPYGSSIRDVLKYGLLYRNMQDEEKITGVKRGLLEAADAFESRYKADGKQGAAAL